MKYLFLPLCSSSRCNCTTIYMRLNKQNISKNKKDSTVNQVEIMSSACCKEGKRGNLRLIYFLHFGIFLFLYYYLLSSVYLFNDFLYTCDFVQFSTVNKTYTTIQYSKTLAFN